ncbi:hypothetical protein [Hungatella effluvii]|uniref:hypothetical protein n=1 Tax=Hungatella effluvii TaxID=1096246 RepID=UPI002A7EC192|nr:hypothetical protein [Hungatella effluvii]
MILSQKKIEEIAVAVIRDFQKSFFGSEADDPARFALPTPIDQFASDYLNLKVSFQKLSSDGSIYGLTAYVDTEYQIEVDGSQRSIFLKPMMWFWTRASLNQRIFGNSAENADLRWRMSALTRYCFSWIPMTER